MDQDNNWVLSDDTVDLRAIFDAAKRKSPQIVQDRDGVYTILYARRGPGGSSRALLTGGIPDKE